jgi:hypothetical protein
MGQRLSGGDTLCPHAAAARYELGLVHRWKGHIIFAELHCDGAGELSSAKLEEAHVSQSEIHEAGLGVLLPSTCTRYTEQLVLAS